MSQRSRQGGGNRGEGTGGWARGRPQSPGAIAAPPARESPEVAAGESSEVAARESSEVAARESSGVAAPRLEPDAASAGVVPGSATPAARAAPGPATPVGRPRHLKDLKDLTATVTAEWAPTAGRLLLGVVMLWFGYHELLLPGEWTQYVPVISESSSLAVILVLAHGWVLLVLSAALLAGIAPRVAAAVASLVMLEIVISLAATGLSDTALRDVGVLGLAVCLTGCKNQRLVLRN
jgi:uncharacterized membrane protein YphA (DoxX/SURF4 family)